MGERLNEQSSPSKDRQIRIKISNRSEFYSEQDIINSTENGESIIETVRDGLGRGHLTYRIYQPDNAKGIDLYVPLIVRTINDYPIFDRHILTKHPLIAYPAREHAMNALSKMVQQKEGQKTLGINPDSGYADY